MNIEDLKKRIADESSKLGIDIRQLRTKVRVDWFPKRSPMEVSIILGAQTDPQEQLRAFRALVPEMGPTVIAAGQKFPFNTSMLVLSVFASDEGWNVYALPLTGEPGADSGRPTRYLLSSAAPVMDAEQMTLPAFIAEIVNEFSIVDADATARTREKALILEHLEANAAAPGYSVRDAILDIQEDKYLPDEDGEEVEGDYEPEGESLPPPAGTPAVEAATPSAT
jgi:hypothetical protein